MNPVTGQSAVNAGARRQALLGWRETEAPPSGLIYRSRGRVLLIGGETALLYAPRLLPELKPQVLVTDASDEPSVPSLPLAGRALSVDGWLGDFRIEIGTPGERDHERIEADIILDLGDHPAIDRELLPPGYYRPGDEPLVLDALVEEIKSLRGSFEKPRFFLYDAAACAHARNGVTGCSRCIEACPAEAISASGDGIEVNPMLCQGGGSCAAVCPSGAVGYALPDSRTLQEQIRQLLNRYREAGGEHPVLLFQAREHAIPVDQLAPHVLQVVVEELASVGLELMLSALALGAGSLRMLRHTGLPEKSRRVIEEEMHMLRAILEAQGYARQLIDWIEVESLPLDFEAALPEGFEAAGFAALGDKRQRLFLALDHLRQQAGQPVDEIELAAGAPFGAVEVDQVACTLCLACAGACPTGALQAGGDRPGLRLIEMNCLQCGLCVGTCPEKAMRMRPRLLLQREARRTPRSLYEEPAFACIRCGKPFASRRVIDRVMEKLQGNPMFATEAARDRLRMCEDCRIADMALQDPDQLLGVTEAMRHD